MTEIVTGMPGWSWRTSSQNHHIHSHVLFFVIFTGVISTGNHKGGGSPQWGNEEFMIKQQRKRRMEGESKPQETGTFFPTAQRKHASWNYTALSCWWPKRTGIHVNIIIIPCILLSWSMTVHPSQDFLCMQAAFLLSHLDGWTLWIQATFI